MKNAQSDALGASPPDLISLSLAMSRALFLSLSPPRTHKSRFLFVTLLRSEIDITYTKKNSISDRFQRFFSAFIF